MQLKFLLSSLNCACANTLTNFALHTLSDQAALAIGFDANTDPHIVFVANTAEPKCPPYISSGVVFFRDLTDLVTKLAALGLNHDQAIGRMAYTILALLPTRLSEINTAQDNRIWTLVGLLSNYAVQGIHSGINAEPPPAKAPVLAHCGQPQSN